MVHPEFKSEEVRLNFIRMFLNNKYCDDTELYYNDLTPTDLLDFYDLYLLRTPKEDQLPNKNPFLTELLNGKNQQPLSLNLSVPQKRRNEEIHDSSFTKKSRRNDDSAKLDPPKRACRDDEYEYYDDEKRNWLMEKKTKMKKKKPDSVSVKALTIVEAARVLLGLNEDLAKIEATEEPVLVIQKLLYKSDVAKNNGRLSLPFTQINCQFLSVEEEAVLLNKNCRIKAKLIDPSGNICDIYLTKWDMRKGESSKSSYTYNLVKGWNEVVSRNGLHEGMLVQLWSFHIGPILWFALYCDEN